MKEYCLDCGSILVCNEWDGCGTTCECHIKKCNMCNTIFFANEGRDIICKLIELTIKRSEQNEDDFNAIKRSFHALSLPPISLANYINRLINHMDCSIECYIIALIYITRATRTHKLKINMFNIHRLLLVSLIIAIKFHEDKYFSNKYYATVGGISNKELNDLELKFLHLIDFDTSMDSNMFIDYIKQIGMDSKND